MQATRGTAAIPSLFADDADARSPARFALLAELEGHKEVRRTSPASLVTSLVNCLRHHPWLAAGTASVLVVVALVLLVQGVPDVRDATGAHRDASASQASAPADAPPVHPAVILDDPPPSRVMAGGVHADSVDGAEADPMQLLRADPAPVAAPIIRRRSPVGTDSDVDLLAALVQHAGRMTTGPATTATRQAGSPPAPSAMQGTTGPDAADDPAEVVSQALARCPAANTEAGIGCRQSACTDRWGEHPSCPRPTAATARPD